MSPQSYIEDLTNTVLNVDIHQYLGLKLVSRSLDPVPTAKVEFTSTSRHLVSTGTVHGGISSLFLDAACFLAVIPILEEGQGTATIMSSFQIIGAEPGEGKRYEVEGRMVRKGRNVVFCEGEVRCDGKLIAKGNFVKSITGGKGKGEREAKSKL